MKYVICYLLIVAKKLKAVRIKYVYNIKQIELDLQRENGKVGSAESLPDYVARSGEVPRLQLQGPWL